MDGRSEPERVLACFIHSVPPPPTPTHPPAGPTLPHTSTPTFCTTAHTCHRAYKEEEKKMGTLTNENIERPDSMTTMGEWGQWYVCMCVCLGGRRCTLGINTHSVCHKL